METKRCPTCGETKPTTEFHWRTRVYAKAGAVRSPMSSCKECKGRYEASRYRKRRPDVPEGTKWCGGCRRYLPRESFGVNTARPDELQNYCRKCQRRAVRLGYHRAVDMLGKSKAVSAPQKLRWKAGYYVSLAVFFGDLVPKPCEVCGAKEEIQAHHTDYLRPLDVTWLCRQHHSAVHGGKPTGNLSRRFKI